MGTASRIGYELPDHSVVSVYCHYDGYVQHNGRLLIKHYRNREDVQELINGGSMSSLRTRGTWELTNSLRDDKGEYIRDSEGYIMSENDREPQPLYHTERGEDINVEHTSFDDFVAGHSCEEYAYLYDLQGVWKAWKIGLGKTPLEPIELLCGMGC